jgi:hypothetical protein
VHDLNKRLVLRSWKENRMERIFLRNLVSNAS